MVSFALPLAMGKTKGLGRQTHQGATSTAMSFNFSRAVSLENRGQQNCPPGPPSRFEWGVANPPKWWKDYPLPGWDLLPCHTATTPGAELDICIYVRRLLP